MLRKKKLVFLLILLFSQTCLELSKAQDNPTVQLILNRQTVRVAGTTVSYTINWGVPEGTQAQSYVIQVAGTDDREFNNPVHTFQAENVSSYEIPELRLGASYLVRVGYKVHADSAITGWSSPAKISISEQRLPIQDLIESEKTGFISIVTNTWPEMDFWTGQFIVWILGIWLVMGLAIFVYKWIQIRNENVKKKRLRDVSKAISKHWCAVGNDEEKLKQFHKSLPPDPRSYNNNNSTSDSGNDLNTKYIKIKGHSILPIIHAGLKNHIGNFGKDNVSQEVDRDMEKQIGYEAGELKKQFGQQVNFLAIFAEVSPLLGLFGTVSGLLIAFFKLHETMLETNEPSALVQSITQGIYTAIITTVAGLVLAICFTYLNRFLQGVLDRTVASWNDFYIQISREIDAKEVKSCVKETA